MADSVAAAVPFINAVSTGIGAVASGIAAVRGSSAKMPKIEAPKVTPVATAPTTDDAAIQRARRDAIMRRQAASGRASTQLTGDDKLG